MSPKGKVGRAFERTVLVFHKMKKEQKDHRLYGGTGEERVPAIWTR